MTTTSSHLLRSSWTTCEQITPAPPVTKIFIVHISKIDVFKGYDVVFVTTVVT